MPGPAIEYVQSHAKRILDQITGSAEVARYHDVVLNWTAEWEGTFIDMAETILHRRIAKLPQTTNMTSDIPAATSNQSYKTEEGAGSDNTASVESYVQAGVMEGDRGSGCSVYKSMLIMREFQEKLELLSTLARCSSSAEVPQSHS